MWCRTVRKLIYDYVDGLVEGRTAGHIRIHLDRCVQCAAAAEDARHLTSSLAAWDDLPAPEDGLHRLETRLAFLPQLPAAPPPQGKLYTLVLPYLAGVASAAALLLALLPTLRPEESRPAAPNTAPVVMEKTASSELMPGEQELTYRDMRAVVDEHGNLIELSRELRDALRRQLGEEAGITGPGDPLPRPDGVNRATPVDYQER